MRVESNFDFAQELAQRWNKKLRSVRISCFVISALMVLCGVLCAVFPVQSVLVVENIAAVVIMALGVYECIVFACDPPFLRSAGTLASGILNIFLGVMLLVSPSQITISTFAFMFGLVLMVLGVDKIAFAGKLSFFGIADHGWVVVSGVMDTVMALALMFAPLVSTLVLNYVMAGYLLVLGITLCIEAFSLKEWKADR